MCRPKSIGGAGILDLDRFCRALRMRWPWYSWSEPKRPWSSFPVQFDDSESKLFAASISIQLGDGNRVLFWMDDWTGHGCLATLAPNLFGSVKHKNRTVAHEINNSRWITNIKRIDSFQQLLEFVKVWSMLQGVVLQPSVRDMVTWKWNSSALYTAKSA